MENKEMEIYSIVIDLISRVCSLENILLEKGLISKEEFAKEANKLAAKLADILKNDNFSKK